MSESCCICYNVLDDENCLQVCSCNESWLCFDCLIDERWGNDNVSAWETDFNAWWDHPMRCPICNTDMQLDVSLEKDLQEFWTNKRNSYVPQKYGLLNTKYTNVRSRLEIAEQTIELERHYARVSEDKTKEALAQRNAMIKKLKKTHDELQDANKRIIKEMEKCEEMTALYMKRRRDSLDDLDFARLIMNKKPKHQNEFNFVFPKCDLPLSEIFENLETQSQV